MNIRVRSGGGEGTLSQGTFAVEEGYESRSKTVREKNWMRGEKCIR